MNFLTNISADKKTDKELILAFKESNDSRYLSILYQRYMDLVFGVCFKYFKEAERSKDAVMDIYEELHYKLRSHEVENFKGWLHTLARNFCLMQLRSPKNLKTTEFSGDFMQSIENTHLTNEAFEKEESFLKLEDCLKRLPGDQQKTIELFFLQKKCYNEIAEMTGHDWNKVRSFIQNGKRNLKLCIEGKNK
ncbi:sigma-70 family RNA polymerase sigma factor [Ferruginibacter lapsinanis]|uniref:RNA polymerase sigma factor n=1 Tax=Ferruginibacter lapsinanis TaxID=563172 RepID=UPI001E50EDBF|nr:sigma-70 family RNA polymerase sigma factor [Ferruginibacter lapsinanis]UEG48624.1 sigma-70 family RNA polymerase sigma factor [Ferruginibacter lapsinanis]